MDSKQLSQPPEHFCTLFDSYYLPIGMNLHHSLMTHAQPFHLWILCMDESVEQALLKLNLPQVTLIPLQQVETPELLAVKPTRSRGEYCWTLTPFTFQSVFDRDTAVQRVTYVDADLFFFDNPKILLNEFRDDRHVLFTEHAYAPEYDQSATSGRFCVQFMTFRRTHEAAKVMNWWQERCLEWCFNRAEAGKFGDQIYLDQWPTLFEQEVQIIQAVEKTLAPWNVNYFQKKLGTIDPVFYHFHGFKLISEEKAQLYLKYHIGHQEGVLYQNYIQALKANIKTLKSMDIPVHFFPLSKRIIDRIYRWKWLLFEEIKFRKI